MKNSVNIGIIGLGGRGTSMMSVMAKMEDINILAVCDKYPDRVDNAVKILVDSGRPAPMGTVDYNEVLDMPGIDSVYIATDWECHVKIAIDSMKKGIPAAMEVGGAYTLDECWELVHTYEETGVWTMMMENCCYGEREMMVHNMVREGVFGDIVFCSGQYAHDLRDEVAYGEKNRHYRLRNYIARNCENYPTHELGPIAKLLGINYGNRFVSMSTVCSKATGMEDFVKQHKDLKPSLGSTKFNQTDIVKTFIKTKKGELIELTLDTCLPRFYSRGFTVRGTKGLYQEDGDIVFLDKKLYRKNEWDQKKFWGRGKKFARKYNHSLWHDTTKEMLDAGHGGMDWFIIRAWIVSVKNGTLPPIDVYDAAAWMCITPLSELSIQNGGATVEIPDFTNGKYKNRTPKNDNIYDIR